ncbi:2-hydroxyacid dehydrogenase [Bordetella genomosp. 13]|uniref:2-hydroxyacid dehydrogenase n=1 Tax=Bordetella genomosp. 13 TaxID=463040 RepID=UPI00119CD716|nr:2-hydroxyacid dehydrogenase [Bordetella genomosp. 13]
MTDSVSTRDIDLLMVGPLAPALIDDIGGRYRLHRLWEAADRTAFLREHAAAIRGIVTSGRFGADRALIESLPNLEVINSFGVGYDPIDVDAARERKVVVTNTPGVLDECVADTALALMLAVPRRIAEADRYVREGRWPEANFGLGRKVTGKRCGIVGLGNIGRQIAARAEAFGMSIAYCNRSPRPDAPERYRYYADPAELAAHSDFLVLALPGGAGTRHLVDARVLKALGSQGYLINVARGTVVDEQALVRALQRGEIAGAGLDVFEHEPRVPQALIDSDRTVLLPHIGSGTFETRDAMGDLLLANLDGWFRDRAVRTAVA